MNENLAYRGLLSSLEQLRECGTVYTISLPAGRTKVDSNSKTHVFHPSSRVTSRLLEFDST